MNEEKIIGLPLTQPFKFMNLPTAGMPENFYKICVAHLLRQEGFREGCQPSYKHGGSKFLSKVGNP